METEFNWNEEPAEVPAPKSESKLLRRKGIASALGHRLSIRKRLEHFWIANIGTRFPEPYLAEEFGHAFRSRNSEQAPNLPTVVGSPNIFNNGQSGQTAETINSTSTYSVDPFLPNLGIAANGGTVGAGANRAGVIVFIGTNDAAGGNQAQTLGSLANYCRTRKLKGWDKVAVVTMMSRGGSDTFKNNYDALVRQYWSKWSDLLLDAAANPNWGADGANANTFYMSTFLHWSTTISEQMNGWFYSYAMRRLYGNTIHGTPNIAVASPYLVQPEDVFLLVNDASAISAYMIPAQMFTGQTVTIRNIGAGTLTVYPKPNDSTITNLALTSNVISITAANNYTAGDVVLLNGLTTNPTLNGVSGIISATGLSASGYQIAYTHANISSAAETGYATLANMSQASAITALSLTSDVASITASNNYAAGDTVVLSGLTTTPGLNGTTGTVSATGLSTSGYQIAVTHANISAGAETGIAVKKYAAETINGASSITVASGATCILLSRLSASSTGLANWITLQNS